MFSVPVFEFFFLGGGFFGFFVVVFCFLGILQRCDHKLAVQTESNLEQSIF